MLASRYIPHALKLPALERFMRPQASVTEQLLLDLIPAQPNSARGESICIHRTAERGVENSDG